MDRKTVGRRLFACRAGRSVEQVAMDLRISVSALKKYECGIRVPRDDLKVKMAEYYGKTVAELFF